MRAWVWVCVWVCVRVCVFVRACVLVCVLVRACAHKCNDLRRVYVSIKVGHATLRFGYRSRVGLQQVSNFSEAIRSATMKQLMHSKLSPKIRNMHGYTDDIST